MFLVAITRFPLEEVTSFKTISTLRNYFVPYLWANKGAVVTLGRTVINVANPVNHN